MTNFKYMIRLNKQVDIFIHMRLETFSIKAFSAFYNGLSSVHLIYTTRSDRKTLLFRCYYFYFSLMHILDTRLLDKCFNEHIEFNCPEFVIYLIKQIGLGSVSVSPGSSNVIRGYCVGSNVEASFVSQIKEMTYADFQASTFNTPFYLLLHSEAVFLAFRNDLVEFFELQPGFKEISSDPTRFLITGLSILNNSFRYADKVPRFMGILPYLHADKINMFRFRNGIKEFHYIVNPDKDVTNSYTSSYFSYSLLLFRPVFTDFDDVQLPGMLLPFEVYFEIPDDFTRDIAWQHICSYSSTPTSTRRSNNNSPNNSNSFRGGVLGGAGNGNTPDNQTHNFSTYTKNTFTVCSGYGHSGIVETKYWCNMCSVGPNIMFGYQALHDSANTLGGVVANSLLICTVGVALHAIYNMYQFYGNYPSSPTGSSGNDSPLNDSVQIDTSSFPWVDFFGENEIVPEIVIADENAGFTLGQLLDSYNYCNGGMSKLMDLHSNLTPMEFYLHCSDLYRFNPLIRGIKVNSTDQHFIYSLFEALNLLESFECLSPFHKEVVIEVTHYLLKGG